MKNNTLLKYEKQAKTNIINYFLSLVLILTSFFVLGQNAIVGTGFSSGWGGSCPTTGNGDFNFMTVGWAGGTLHLQTTATGTGNRFFRFGVDWGGQTRQLAITPGSDVEVVPSTTYTLNSACTTSGSQFVNVSNASHNYVFKTLNGGTNPTGTFVFFEVQGDVRTVTSVTRDITNVGSAQSPVITANLSGALSTGQAVYLRYTTNNYANSTVVQMSGSGTTYTANIPTFAGGSNVSYYVFTSGPSNVATDGSNADLYTINWNAGSVNGGSNFTYTVETQYRTAQTGNWNQTATWQIHNGTTWVAATATPTDSNAGLISILNGHTVTVTANVTVDQVVIEVGGQVTLSGGTLTVSNGPEDDFIIFGTYRRTSSGTTMSINSGAIVRCANGGIYEHALSGSGGSVPSITWEDESIFRLVNSQTTATAVTGLNQSFGIVEINRPGQTTATEDITFGDVRNELRVISTGTGRSRWNSAFSISGSYVQTGGAITVRTNSGASNFDVGGNFSLGGGTFRITDANGSSNAVTLNVDGNFTMSGGTFIFCATGSTSGPAFASIKGNVTISGGSFAGGFLRDASGFYFNGHSSEQTLTFGLSLSSGVLDRFYYRSAAGGPTGLNEIYNGTSAQNTITGTGAAPGAGWSAWPTTGSLIKNLTINNAAGVTLSTAKVINTALLRTNGSLSGTPNVTYASGATLHYNGTGAITTADKEFPSSNGPTNFVVSNPGGVTLHANRTLTGNLTVNNSGVLDLGANTLDRDTPGGTITLESGTTLKIGGTNTFPSNYATQSINTTSTVEYNGTNQVVTPLNTGGFYGNLVLSGTGNKTFGGDVNAENLTNGANAVTRVVSGQNLRVRSILTNNGEFTIENNANLIQEGSTNNNAGAISVQRNSSALWRLDYTLWSAPVAGQNLLAFSPLTVANRFYVYNPTTNQYNTIPPSTNAFQTGVGYLIRMPDNHVSNINNNPAQIWEGEFLGVPNNGDVTLTVANNTFNAVGNPYPSTISASAFYAANSLTQPLYFWRKINGAAGSAYATWTTAGGASSGSDATIPNGIIQVGQGFILRSTSTSVEFNNTMRVGNNANQFLRMADIEHNRVRVAMTGPNNFSQNILINYMSGATNEVDPAIDGKYINDSETAFYTLLDEEAYVIQGRALPFDNNDIVPLGFKTTQAGNYSINLIDADGLFEQEQQGIYLRDLALDLIHDFDTGAYTFASDAGVFHNRFELLYQNEVLSVPQNGTTTPGILYTQGNQINLHVGSLELESVRVFDIAGRLIYEESLPNVSEISMSLPGVAKQALLVQYQIKDLGTFTKKIIF